jgi:hypothetical protein
MEVHEMKWFLRACPACGGDLHEDVEEDNILSCFMCSRTFGREEAMLRIGRQPTNIRSIRRGGDQELKPAA